MGKALTLEICKDRLKLINKNIIIMSNEYINNSSYLKCKCELDGYEWNAKWANLSNGYGCPKCAGNIKYSIEEVKENMKKNNIEIISSNYKNTKTKLECRCMIDGYLFKSSYNELLSGKNCPICGISRRMDIFICKEKLKNINPNIDIISESFDGSLSHLKCRCIIDGHEWSASWGNLQQGYGCPVCSGSVVCDKNRLSLLRPDLVKYFGNPNDADNYTIRTHRKVELICPNCNTIKKMKINDLSSYGFGCKVCSDGISIPQKFVQNILKEVDVEFNAEYSPKLIDLGNRKYDIYIPNINLIIEIHGEQHYKYTGRGRSLEEEQRNDLEKYNIAVDNGYLYEIIDCRKSDFDWLEEKCKNTLMKYIKDVHKVDFKLIYSSSMESYKVLCWNKYNAGMKNTQDLSVEFDVCRSTIIKWLKQGNSIGYLYYNIEEVMSNNGKINGKLRGKSIIQLDLNGEFVNNYNSITEASLETNINKSNISSCCNGNRKKSGGFIWKFNN